MDEDFGDRQDSKMDNVKYFRHSFLRYITYETKSPKLTI